MIELRRGDRRLLRLDAGLGHALGLRALVVDLLGDGVILHQLGAAIEVGLGKGQIGACLRQIGFGLLEDVLDKDAGR